MSSLQWNIDHITINELYTDYTQRKRLIITPEYQRDFIWPVRKQRLLIQSILQGFPIPIIFLFRDLNKINSEVLDGKQRITTIFKFVDNELTLTDSEECDISKFFHSTNYKFENLKNSYKHNFLFYKIYCNYLDGDWSSLEKHQLFCRLQNGADHSSGEMLNAIPIPIISKIKQQFKRIIKTDKRKNVLKLFAACYCYYKTQDITLCTDAKLVAWFQTKQYENDELQADEEFMQHIVFLSCHAGFQDLKTNAQRISCFILYVKLKNMELVSEIMQKHEIKTKSFVKAFEKIKKHCENV
jgi:hypothetical protein